MGAYTENEDCIGLAIFQKSCNKYLYLYDLKVNAKYRHNGIGKKLIEEGKAPREKQTEEATLAPMLNKEMALIDWENSDANKIHNLIRGLNPIMGAYSYIDGKKIKFWKSKVLTKEEFFSYKTEFEEYEAKFNNLVPGTILIADDKDGLYIKANGGVLKILEIQGENAKRMPTADFLRGNHLIAGMIFSKEI